VRREGLLEPADAELVHRRHHAPHVLGLVADIGVREDDELIAEGLPDGLHPLNVVGDGIADAKLDRLVALVRLFLASSSSACGGW
jgi:hypothetical protein